MACDLIGVKPMSPTAPGMVPAVVRKETGRDMTTMKRSAVLLAVLLSACGSSSSDGGDAGTGGSATGGTSETGGTPDGGATGGTGGGATGGEADASTPAADCDGYCAAVQAACTGANAQYADDAACQTACAGFATTGMDGDTSGDTLQCRLYHVGVAADDPDTHCGHAGPDGGGVCVDAAPADPCEAYCQDIQAACTGDNAQFADDGACMAACMHYAATGMDGDTSGDTLQCRVYHVGAAADDPATHCMHAGPDGGGVCVDAAPADPCETYCQDIQAACTGGNAQYADDAECMAACADFSQTGTDGDTSGDTLQCRQYHTGAAAGDPATHCMHAGPDGGGVCVDAPSSDACALYCGDIMAACAGDNAQYADVHECLTSCAGFSTDGMEGDTDGDTLQCREYHLGAAMADPDTHCMHAGPTGGGVC